MLGKEYYTNSYTPKKTQYQVGVIVAHPNLRAVLYINTGPRCNRPARPVAVSMRRPPQHLAWAFPTL